MLWKTFYVKPNERSLLFHRSDFQRVLQPGLYHRSGFTRWRLETHDLNQPEAKIGNLELLLQNHRAELEQHLHIVQTAFNEVALVRLGQRWMSIVPNELKAFWRGFVEVEVAKFNLDESLELPQEYRDRLRGEAIQGLQKSQIAAAQIGLLYIDNNFVRPMTPGDYGFWTINRSVKVQALNRLAPNQQFPLEDELIEQHPNFVADYCAVVELSATEVAIVRHKGRTIAILPPSSRKLFWNDVTVAVIDVQAQPKLPQILVAELVEGLIEIALLSHEAIHTLEVNAQHVGLLYLNGVLQATLPPGTHAWWLFGRSFRSESIDLRLQTLEVSGQEILSKDKVPLRLNLTAAYRVVDPVRAKEELRDIADFIYKELQFGLRGAVGTQTLDALLEDKGSIDVSIAEYIRTKVANYGIEVESVGVKDIILPGEIKAILSKVVEAEKAAQANVIRRREETAATRSMLNTVKAMEDNPIALRLKELEVLERIAEKIEHINVNGSLDNVLTDLIRINGRS
jgi:regulator of protease activity HflC (stomatin/prohibitin superfamily)